MWTMIGGPPAEREWKEALVEFGAFDMDEFREDVIDIQGMIHGYIDLNLSNALALRGADARGQPRVIDAHLPGGDRGAPVRAAPG